MKSYAKGCTSNKASRKPRRKMLTVFLIALLLLFDLAAGSFSAVNALNGSPSSELAVYRDGKPVDSILMDEDKKQILTAEGLSAAESYQWQVQLPGGSGSWVDIDRMTGSRCEISCAVLGSLLDERGETAVRCIAYLNGKEYVSNSVEVAVNFQTGQDSAAENISTASDFAKAAAYSLSAGRMAALSVDSDGSEDGDDEYVNITIRYMLEQDGEEPIPVFAPYVAKLQKGTSFSAVVPSPTYAGYKPYVLEEGEYKEASSVSLHYTGLDGNREITVWYRPAEVSYTVRYFLQNISNDDYTEVASRTGTALTGSYPKEDIEVEIDGFTALFHEPDTVAADGSTEFNCYYDRNYYLCNFDCNGGYGVDPVYARYQTPVLVGTPIRAGYKFIGWDKMEKDGSYDGNPDSVFGTVELGNVTYRAIWEEDTTTFTVIYWAENANDDGYSYITSHTYTQTTDLRVRDFDLDQFLLTSDKDNQDYPYYEEADYLKYDKEQTIEANDFVYEQQLDDQWVNCFHIKGDGSTTVNIVYQRKEYNLKFFYAKSARSGRNEKYYVVGGSTYPFGEAVTTDEATMLAAPTEWGEVKELPNLNANGMSRDYHLGSETYDGVTYYYLSFKAKYGADISKLWPASIFEPVERTEANKDPAHKWTGMLAYRSAWNGEHYVKYTQENLNGGNQTIKGVYQKLDSTILYDLSKHEDSDTVRYLCFWENGADVHWSVPKLFVYELYVPVLEGEATDVEHNGTAYKLYINPFNTYDDSNIDGQTPSALEGFTFQERVGITNGTTTDGMDSYTVQFFYTRDSHTLTFYNYDSDDAKEYKKVLYETPIKEYVEENQVPEYPSGLEPGAYEFDGWYPAPNGQGTRIDVNTELTMPASDLTLYAYWKPVGHTVTFSSTYDDMIDGKYIPVDGEESLTADHGSYLDGAKFPEPSSASLGENYVFRGWFYMDSETGEKKAFEAGSMEVLGDMHLFAEWQSSKVVPYTVRYMCGGEIISSETTGYAYAGMTKTFTAKAGDELNEGYQKGYYPSTNSHSILMSTEGKNEFTFEYVYKDRVSYTVRYIDKSTGLELAEAKTEVTTDSVITEKFRTIEDYVPDGYYKRLVLSANEEQNVITFYYTKDETHAIYVVKYMVEALDGTTYSEYYSEEGYGNIGAVIDREAFNISGFTYNRQLTEEKKGSGITVGPDKVSGTVTEDGLELILYYSRKDYPYTVNYLEYGTEKSLQESLTGTAKYGAAVTVGEERIPEIIKTEDGTDYQLIGERERTVTIGETGNLLNIYYAARSVTLNYVAVCRYADAKDYGSVSPAAETVTSINSAAGSVPAPGDGYVFAGWYTDPACTQPVNPALVDDDDRLKITALPTENTAFYYALFEPRYMPLTLEKTVSGTYGDRNEAFTFTITLKDAKYETEPIHTIPVEYAGPDAPEDEKLTFTDNKATLELKHDQSVILSVPNGCEYTVEEASPAGYETQVTAPDGASVDGKTVTGTADSAGTITYTNTKDGNVPTGIRTETLPYLLTAGFALAGGGLLLIRRFRKKEADGG